MTEAGLQTLARSNQAISFWPGRHWSSKLGLDASDYRVLAVEQALKSQGRVSLSVLPHVDQDADYELTQQGQLKLPAASLRAAQQRLATLTAKMTLEGQQFAADGPADPQPAGVPLRLNRQDLLRLLDSTGVRGLMVQGQSDPRTLKVDPEALKVADERGQVEVIVTLRNLRTPGVPVVVAAGNSGYRGAIGFPACVPNAIKVSSHANDGVGNTLSSFSNLPRPSNFAGETIWLAPGGGNGTSMAAPHIAGLYAAAKAALPPGSDNDAVTNYFIGNASVSLNAPFCR